MMENSETENLEPIDSSSECEQVRYCSTDYARLRQRDLLTGVLLCPGRVRAANLLTEVEEGLLNWLENHYGVI